ncbi:MAG TPA: hypothetical protein VKM54_12050 [Myxococcota bacterium]|nr:hypothetical protein [Myxococcota bacterium]
MASHSRSRSVLATAALCALAALLPAAARAADTAPLGKVVALDGDAWVEHPGLAQHALACGDALAEGDVLVTGPGARAGIQAGDVFAQVSGSSQVRLGRGPGGAPTVNVEKGHAYVRRLDLANLRKGGGRVAPPGNCAGTPPPVATGPVPLDRLIGNPVERFNPTDVAAAPPGPGAPGPQPPKVIEPCAIAAGLCFAPPRPPVPIPTTVRTGVIEQPPVSGLPPGVPLPR